MSDALSIAAVTHTLCHVLGDALALALPDERAEVTPGRPSKDAVDEPTVFVHLYRVAPNAAQRNADLSTRSPNGDLLQRPRAAIDLDFLLSFRGDESALVPQRMLGAIVAHLHAYPSLTHERIKRALANARSPLDTCNLAAEGCSVRLSPQDLSADELSKLWATLPQTPYLLSVAYRAATIVIDGAEAPAPPAPVRDLRIDADQREPLRVDAISPTTAHGGDKLTVRGANLGLRARFGRLVPPGSAPVWLPVEKRGLDAVQVSLPEGLVAGSSRLEVMATRDETPLRTFGFGAVLVLPRVVRAPARAHRNAMIELTLDVVVLRTQRCVLRIEGRAVRCEARDTDGSTLRFRLSSDLALGPSHASVEVDGLPTEDVTIDVQEAR